MFYSSFIKRSIPVTLFVFCAERQETYSIYLCDSSASLDDISEVIRNYLYDKFGNDYKRFHYDIFTDFDFLHTKYYKP